MFRNMDVIDEYYNKFDLFITFSCSLEPLIDLGILIFGYRSMISPTGRAGVVTRCDVSAVRRAGVVTRRDVGAVGRGVGAVRRGVGAVG